MSDEAIGGLSGAAQGAAAGAMVGGPLGAVVGGLLGGISGLFGGGAAHAKKMAYRRQLKMQRRNEALQRRDMIRQFRIAQASAVAQAAMEDGGLQSSGAQGVIGSLQTQNRFNLQLFNVEAQDQAYINRKLQKAQQLQGYSNLVGSLTNSFFDIAGTTSLGSKMKGFSFKGTPTNGATMSDSLMAINTDWTNPSSTYWTKPSWAKW